MGKSNRRYNQELAKKIQPDFEHYVKPDSVLHVFAQYNSDVLTKRDMENVQARTRQYGDIDGAVLLLERLLIYDDWFCCLMKVLRNSDVKLSHAADSMEEIKDEFDEEWRKTGESSDSPSSLKQQDSFHLLRTTPKDFETSSSEGDSFVVLVPSMCQSQHSDQTSELQNHLQAVGLKDSEYITPVESPYQSNQSQQTGKFEMISRGEDVTDSITHDYIDVMDGYDLPPDEKYSGYELPTVKKYCSDTPQDDATLVKEIEESAHNGPASFPSPRKSSVKFGDADEVKTDAFDGQTEPKLPLQPQKKLDSVKEKLNSIKKVPEVNHGPEYDFAVEEVTKQLSQIPGWHYDVPKSDIGKKLNSLKNEDGHYILWYWESKKRPALCVTDGKQLKALVVHKRPKRTNKQEVEFYFIDKKDHRSTNLRRCVEYHLANGVKDMGPGGEGRVIKFLNPVE